MPTGWPDEAMGQGMARLLAIHGGGGFAAFCRPMPGDGVEAPLFCNPVARGRRYLCGGFGEDRCRFHEKRQAFFMKTLV